MREHLLANIQLCHSRGVCKNKSNLFVAGSHYPYLKTIVFLTHVWRWLFISRGSYIFIKFKIHLQKKLTSKPFHAGVMSAASSASSDLDEAPGPAQKRARLVMGIGCLGNTFTGWMVGSFWRLFSLQRAYRYHKGTKRNSHIISSILDSYSMYVRVCMTRIWHLHDTHMTRMTRMTRIWHAYDTYDTLKFSQWDWIISVFKYNPRKWLRVIPCRTVSYAT